MKRQAISPNVSNKVKSLHEVEEIIKANDSFCRRTKHNNVAAKQNVKKVKAIIVTNDNKSHRIINRTKGSVIRDKIAQIKSPIK